MKAIFCAILFASHLSAAWISYGCTGGRFGDHLLIYLRAKWLSYRYEIPLLYIPFIYSSELVLDDREILYDQRLFRGLAKVTMRAGVHPHRSCPVIYDSLYFPAFREESGAAGWGGVDVDWKDPKFRQIALELLAPKQPLNLTRPPPGSISIAVHVREGGGFDTDHTRFHDPIKLPPLPFYKEALLKVLALFPDRPIYCHLFTDAIDVQAVAEKVFSDLPQNGLLQFEYRREGNHHTKHVLEDFFSLFSFDVLIRPRSNFSIIPSFLHDYAILVYPTQSITEGSRITITDFNIDINEPLYKNLLE